MRWPGLWDKVQQSAWLEQTRSKTSLKFQQREFNAYHKVYELSRSVHKIRDLVPMTESLR